jgi:Transposase DDE domain
METISEHAQLLVYSLVCLMPTPYQKASLQAMLGLFLGEEGHALPAYTEVKSPSALSRFLNHYSWSTRCVIRTTRRRVLQQLLRYCPRKDQPLLVLIDLTSLEKCGLFPHLGTCDNRWVRWLNHKRGLHLVVLYLVIGGWRIPWSFRVWQGKGYPSPSQLARTLLSNVPQSLSQGRTVIVLADTEFGTIDFLPAVKRRSWCGVVGVRSSRKLQDGRSLQDLYRQGGTRGQQVQLQGMPFPVTVSWFWLKRQGGGKELRFVMSTHPYSGAYLVQLGRKRWAIEGFFKTIKHRFGWHCFGQSTQLGVYRWLVLSLIAYLLAYWMFCGSGENTLDWKQVSQRALQQLLPTFLWLKLLHNIHKHSHIANQLGFKISIKPLPLNSPTGRCNI